MKFIVSAPCYEFRIKLYLLAVSELSIFPEKLIFEK